MFQRFAFLLCLLGASALDNGMTETPPMGWSSWNKFHCGIDEQLIRGIADAVNSSGLAAAGYDHINLDDCWMDANRTASGDLQGDREHFPAGMKNLGDYIHQHNLKYGLYLDPGTLTCQRRPGSFRHEVADANYLARVGADYLKHDACYSSDEQQLFVYFSMRDALNKTGRRIGYSICPNDARCNDPSAVMWDASSVANVNMCRGDRICRDVGLEGRPPEVLNGVLRRRGSQRPAPGSGSQAPDDIVPTWHSWLCMLDVQVQFDSMRYAGPGHYVMPDMLEVGNGMTDTEDRSHFSMWAMIAAPLITGHDVRTQSAATLETLTNEEVIAISQDIGGKPARRVVNTGGYTGVDVWARQLHNGDYAAALFNRGNTSAANVTLNWTDVGLPPSQPAKLRDLWSRADLGTFTARYTAEVPPHTVVLLRVAQAPGPDFASTSVAALPCVSTRDDQQWAVGAGNSGSQWSLHPASAPALCLDLYDCDVTKGANMQIYSCHGSGEQGCGAVNQGFFFDEPGPLPLSSATAIHSAVNRTFCLEAGPDGTVGSRPCVPGSAAQRFAFSSVGANRYVIKNAGSGACLTA